MASKQYLYYLDGKYQRDYTEEELRAEFAATDQPTTPVVDTKPPVTVPPVTTPPITTAPLGGPTVVDDKPQPVYGYPRRQVGTKTIDDNGQRKTYPVYALASVSYLALQTSEKPDTIAFKGTDWEYDSLPGVARPDGAPSEWYGNSEPEGAIQPDGYEKLFFNNDPEQPYYRQITGIKPGSDYNVVR